MTSDTLGVSIACLTAIHVNPPSQVDKGGMGPALRRDDGAGLVPASPHRIAVELDAITGVMDKPS
ncbi:MAG: hypothetical protein ISP41_02740 [Alphaproteobacteria bacterium]|nr:hypothetical protein [Alphaproteobacteria bacterium]